jgi:hypothetical protein
MIIYKIDIQATPGMVYIGQTTRLLGHRWRQHKAPSSTTLIGRALQAYGERTQAYDEATITPLYEVNTREELDTLEISTIKALNTIYPHGYNLHEGGSGKRKRTGGTSDSKEVYWDDEPEVEDDEDDIAERLTGPKPAKGKHQPAKIRKIVGNIMFKYQAVKEQNEYIQHMDSSVM